MTQIARPHHPTSTTPLSLAPVQVRKVLLVCGIVSSLLYVAMNIVGALQWDGYSLTSQSVSELFAIGVPSRPLWVTPGHHSVGWGDRAHQHRRVPALGGCAGHCARTRPSATASRGPPWEKRFCPGQKRT
jgi:hypothetical protein